MGFLDRLLGRRVEEEASLTLSFSEIPGYLDSHEAEARTELAKAAAGSRKVIIAVIEELRAEISALPDAVPGDDLHPRLRHVASHAVPSFMTSMENTLSRPMPEEPEAFYKECVEFVNACSKSMHGQGRYIAAVLPEEMKEIRQSIAVVGREINSMNEVFGPAQKRIAQSSEARNLYESIVVGFEGHKRAGMAVDEAGSEKSEAAAHLKILKKEYSALSESSDYREAMDEASKVKSLEVDLRTLDEEYSALGSATSNLFRKSAYLAEKEGDRDHARQITAFSALLNGPLHEDYERVTGAYETLCPALMEIIRKNPDLIKNKHEAALFADCSVLRNSIQDLSVRFNEISVTLREGRQRLEASEILSEKASLESQIPLQRDIISGAEMRISDEEIHRGTAREKTECHLENLKQALALLSGREVVILGIPA